MVLAGEVTIREGTERGFWSPLDRDAMSVEIFFRPAALDSHTGPPSTTALVGQLLAVIRRISRPFRSAVSREEALRQAARVIRFFAAKPPCKGHVPIDIGKLAEFHSKNNLEIFKRCLANVLRECLGEFSYFLGIFFFFFFF